MTLYKINIDNRNYNTFHIFNANTLEPIQLDNFIPSDHKLFTNDVFTYNKNQVEIDHSSIRISENIPAVLILSDNKTYGRELKNNNTKQGKLLYKCIPDDCRLPIFLIPYELKKIGFSKNISNI